MDKRQRHKKGIPYEMEGVVFLLERDSTETVWRKLIVLTGIERGGRTPAPRQGGCLGRARYGRCSVAKTNRANGPGVGRGGSPLDSFFFFDKFCI